MEKNGQPLLLVRPTFMGWVAAISSAVAIVLAAFLLPNLSVVIQCEVFAAVVLAGGWFAGLGAGIVIGLFPALLVRYGASPLNAHPLDWPGFAFELLFFYISWKRRRLVRCAPEIPSGNDSANAP